jgi:hypothetical protein
MMFDSIDTGPEAARAALDHSRQVLCARVATLQSQPDAAFIDAFPAVVAAVEIGFRHEEMLLDRIGGTCLRTRHADDAVILCALHRVTPCIERGDIALGRQVAAALGAVLSLRPVPVPVPPPVPDAQAAPLVPADAASRVSPVSTTSTISTTSATRPADHGAGGWRMRGARRPALHAVRSRSVPPLS